MKSLGVMLAVMALVAVAAYIIHLTTAELLIVFLLFQNTLTLEKLSAKD